MMAASPLVLLTAPVAADPGAIDPAAALPPTSIATPTLIWRDMTALGITCQVHTAKGIDTGVFTKLLCDAVSTRSAVGAPVPVTVARLGGEALKPGVVTLLVHASVTTVHGASVVALTIRPFRNDGGEGAQFFVAPPRAFALDDTAALATVVRTILAETLPWQAGARSTRAPIPAR